MNAGPTKDSMQWNGQILNVVEGWIHPDEMHLVAQYMKSEEGSILEVGAANGRLFSYLFNIFPEWEYQAIDPWSYEDVHLQVDWDKPYFEEGNLREESITLDDFVRNCPFAEMAWNMYWEEFHLPDKQFDIVSMGLVSSRVEWDNSYEKAFKYTKPGGYVIGRNLHHPKYGAKIRDAIKDHEIIDTARGSFVLQKHEDN